MRMTNRLPFAILFSALPALLPMTPANAADPGILQTIRRSGS